MMSQLPVFPATKMQTSPAHLLRRAAGLLPLILLASSTANRAHAIPVTSGLVLHLSADAGVTTSGSDVTAWADQSGQGHSSSSVESAPQLIPGALNGKPVVR